MAPLLPLGLAILGLGCTIPLTIGGSEFDQPIVSPGDDGGIDAGHAVEDAGSPAVDAGTPQDAGFCNPSGPSQNYTACCSEDVLQGYCNNAAWQCNNFRVCTSSAGKSCFSTGHTCTSFSDCCTEVCYKGFCSSSRFPPSVALTPNGGTCRSLQVSCNSFSDCCSQNCAFGQCVPAPTPTTCGGFDATCTSFTQCCSLECDHGNCRDTTLPWYLQETGSQVRDATGTASTVQDQSKVAPHFQLNGVDDFAGQNPTR